ncbi:MAG: malonate decarboxylase subunit epsilon, partial [Polaromonas sp.]
MSILFTFPGQGAQRAGMLHALAQDARVRDAIDEASETLGRDALALDSADALRSSVSVQLALLIAGVATARHLIHEAGPP